MRSLDTFLQVCAVAIDSKHPLRDRQNAIDLIQLRRFDPARHGADGVEKAEQLKEAMLLWWSGRAARDNRLIIDQLVAEIARLPDHVAAPQAEPWWGR